MQFCGLTLGFSHQGSETISLWHKSTAQCINPGATDARAILGADYLVDCNFDETSSRLILTSGTYGGDVTLSEVTDAGMTPIVGLRGHSAVVRCTLPWTGPVGSPLNGRVLTGGEDGRICSWDLSSAGAPQPSAVAPQPARRDRNTPGKSAEKGAARAAPY